MTKEIIKTYENGKTAEIFAKRLEDANTYYIPENQNVLVFTENKTEGSRLYEIFLKANQWKLIPGITQEQACDRAAKEKKILIIQKQFATLFIQPSDTQLIEETLTAKEISEPLLPS